MSYGAALMYSGESEKGRADPALAEGRFFAPVRPESDACRVPPNARIAWPVPAGKEVVDQLRQIDGR